MISEILMNLAYWEVIKGFNKSEIREVISIFLQLYRFLKTPIYGIFHNF